MTADGIFYLVAFVVVLAILVLANLGVRLSNDRKLRALERHYTDLRKKREAESDLATGCDGW